MLWTPEAAPGLEHLRLTTGPAGALADSLVIGVSEGQPFRARYQVRCDPDWRARETRVEVLGAGRPALVLDVDGAGRWTVNGAPAPALDGCIDVDIAVTPFTNTLPIRRLRLAPNEAADITVVYITVPGLSVAVESQRYSCLRLDPSGGLYRYLSRDGGFTADLPVDRDGLVLDYPRLFRRVWPQ